MKKCPNCGAQNADDSRFCTECGKPIPQGGACPHCGAAVNDGDVFCQNCGKKISEVPINSEPTKNACPICGMPINDEDDFCQNCGKKISEEVIGNSSDNAKKCPNCGSALNNEDAFCQSCGNRVNSVVNNNTQENHMVLPNPPAKTMTIAPPPPYQKTKKSNGALIAVIVLLALIICGVGGYFYYNNVYLPEKIDREAPRYYTMANVVVLRSSRSAGADFNKVASLPYGTELITYERDGEWAKVKVNSQSGDKQEGYVASPYILNKADFFLMNSIFGNQDSKETIITTKCRIALLNYFKEKQYIGKIDDQMRIDAGISVVPNSDNQWQVFTKPKDAKPNSVFFKRLYNKSSQFTDFAVIITNSSNSKRKLLYFYFDDDETPHLLKEQDAPSQGYIVDISYEYDYYSSTKELYVQYSY